MSNEPRTPRQQKKLDETLRLKVLGRDFPAVQDYIAAGADPYYRDRYGYNALDTAVERGNYELVNYLLDEVGMGDNPETVGTTLRFAETADMLRLLAGYNPDSTARFRGKLSASDNLICRRNYDLLAVYEECGLVRAPQKQAVINIIIRNCDVKQFETYTNIKVPEHFRQKLIDFDNSDVYREFPRKQKMFKKMVMELMLNA